MKYQIGVITELKNTLERFNSRMNGIEASFHELEDKAMGHTQKKQQNRGVERSIDPLRGPQERQSE